MKDSGAPLYPSPTGVQAFDYKGIRVGFFPGARTPETTFQSNTLRPLVKIALEGVWCDLEISKCEAHYRYNLRHETRAYFSRFVLVQGDQCELLSRQQLAELTKNQFVPVALPAGLEGLATYLDAIVEHKVKKEQLLDGIETDIVTRLLNAGLKKTAS